MPTTLNPTPLYGPEYSGEDDPAIYGDDDQMNEVDTNFVDDGTGLHPTATTYATTTVAVSHVYGPAQATPTVDTYHVSGIPPANMLAFNKRIGAGSNGLLVFRSYPLEDPIWGNYSPWTDYRNIVYSPDYAPNKPMWLDGMTLRDSWDYRSPITNQVYHTIAPTVVFIDVQVKRAVYYFFDVIFNDFQASHGYANWDYSKDGWPSPYWPGMIQVVRSVIKSSQVPSNRDSYEVYMTREYGTPLAVAPFVRSKEDMSTGQSPPTRYRSAASATSIVSKDVPPENLAIQLDTTGESTESSSAIDMSDVSTEVAALQAAAVAKAVAAQQATDAAAQVAAVNAALASGAISQSQALAAQAATYAAAQATAVAQQAADDATAQAQALATAAKAGAMSQAQAVAAQAAADAAAQSTALAAQSAADAAAQAKAVASAVAAQAATDSTQQAAAVAAQAASDAAAQKAAVASAVAAQAASDATALSNAVAAQARNDAAWLVKAPKFTTGTVTIGANYTGVGFAANMSLSGMDYSHVWLPAVNNYAVGTCVQNSGSSTTLSSAQTNGGAVYSVLQSGSTYYSYASITTWVSNAGILGYSGWLRSGTVYQQVGWVINTGTASSPVRTLVTTGYGYTSLAPTVNNGGTPSSSTTYTLTTANTQSEILGQMNVSTSSASAPAVIGFIYDGSVGTYGQVTWISQI